MTTAAARAMSSAELQRKLRSPRPSINVADIRTTNIQQRYESEEEEMSEAEASGRTESVFSPIENDSDTGVSELDSPQVDVVYESYTSEDKFALRIPTSPTSEVAISRASLISTSNRASCITLMPLLQPQPMKAVSMGSSTSTSISPPLSPATESILATDHITEEETLQYFRSFYPDTVPSDEEGVADTSFLIATPISFYAPESKPHLISIEPLAAQTLNGRTTENKKKQEHAPIIGEVSSKSSLSNANIKNRISGLKMGKYGKRRSSIQPVSESTATTKTRFSNASVPSLSNLGWRSSSALSMNSESELHSSVTSRESRDVTPSSYRRHTLLPSPRMLEQRSTDNRRQIAEKHTADNVILEEHIGRTDDRRTSKAKKKHNIPPVPQITGIAISSNVSSPTSITSSPSSTRSTPLGDQRLMLKPIFPKHGASRRGSNGVISSVNSSPSPINSMDRSSNFPFPSIPSSDSSHATAKRRGFHERTHSINSLASTTSMPNFVPPDNPSPRSATHRYRQQFYPADAFPSERPPSRERVNPSLKPNPRNTYTFAPRGSMSTTNLSYLSSASTATPRLNSPSDVNNMSWNYHTGTWSPSGAPGADSVKTPLRKQAHSKSIKRLYETSESVSRAGTKAFNGLGSILRKKHVTSGDERWSSNRVV
ncbi:hypothetical protein EMCG_06985 [[Emmonsia] crescens]|uniref:Uncharacterized protein n=1 Tax=[Emmonsia] crescens TaxID=73230 RepID=A0A0G2JBE4_9EURO|nr:hypothetical protein EMCG_06985 [Emmonsia crescens UAMH 3008]